MDKTPMNELSNAKLIAHLVELKNEHVDELLRRFDQAIGALEQPNLYYKSDVDAFVKGKKTDLPTR
jgi:hypothetical protein